MQSRLRVRLDNETIHAPARIRYKNRKSHRLQTHALGYSPPKSCNFSFQIKNSHSDADDYVCDPYLYIFNAVRIKLHITYSY
jgi:hypothetical protein